MANLINWQQKTEFTTGDTIRVHQTVSEGDKTRTQIFEGVVIRIKGHQGLKSFTVRKVSTGNIGVERIFPELTPTVTKIELVKRGKVRRAVLNYLKDKVGRRATRIKDVFVKGIKQEVEEQVVKKDVEITEDQLVAKRAIKAAKAEKALKQAEKASKEKKKSKKKAKIERKEKVFVR